MLAEYGHSTTQYSVGLSPETGSRPCTKPPTAGDNRGRRSDDICCPQRRQKPPQGPTPVPGGTTARQINKTNKQTNKSSQTSWAQQKGNWFNNHVKYNARENRILASLTGSVQQARFRNPSNTRCPWNLGNLVSKWGRDRAHDRTPVAPFTNTVQLRSQHGHTITPNHKVWDETTHPLPNYNSGQPSSVPFLLIPWL